MFDPDWEEIFSQPAFAELPEYFHKSCLERMTATPPEIEATPFFPIGFLTTVPRSPRPKPSASTTGDKKQKKPQQVLMRQSPRKNHMEICEKGKVDWSQQLTELIDLIKRSYTEA